MAAGEVFKLGIDLILVRLKYIQKVDFPQGGLKMDEILTVFPSCSENRPPGRFQGAFRSGVPEKQRFNTADLSMK
jgi:hypothetical protein